jgi:hypothetical protein
MTGGGVSLDILKIEELISKINIDRQKIIDITLASIALEQDGLARIIKAEGDKLKQMMNRKNSCLTPEEFIAVNESVQKTLREVSKKEMLLESRIQNVINLIEKAKQLYDKK